MKLKNNVRKALFSPFLSGKDSSANQVRRYHRRYARLRPRLPGERNTHNVLQRPERESDRLNNSAEIGT